MTANKQAGYQGQAMICLIHDMTMSPSIKEPLTCYVINNIISVNQSTILFAPHIPNFPAKLHMIYISSW